MTADKLVDDVKHHRITASGARLELQRTYVDIRQRNLAEAESNARVAALEKEQQARAAQAERVAEEARERERQAQAAATAQAQAAVLACIQHANTRLQAQLDGAPGMQAAAISAGIAYTRQAAPRRCSEDSNWYQTIAPPPPRQTVTNCRQDALGVRCTTQ